MIPLNSTSGFNYTIGSNATTPVNGTETSSAHSTHNVLPLHPRLTPAFGIAGALLMITGIPYAFASLRLTWIYRSLSCAYLISICLTVLIVDVMDVPVSDGIQGAYLVAIVVPGICIGGILHWYVQWLARRSGCVLGGFCIAMWIETLRKGGLIKSSQMTAVLIGVMCAVSLAPSIPTPLLKKWVDLAYMIFSAFSGSTALILGIDCYSRAGLKEFWVYTWHFKRVELFGFGTKTYPMTKGIIVEIVLVPIVFLFALVIQWKFWTPLKDQRERELKRIAALTEDQERQALDTGRAFNMTYEKDLAAWEAKNKDPERKKPDVNQRQVDAPSPSKAGRKLHSAKEFIMDKLKPDVRVSVTSDIREQHHDKISPVEAHKSNAKTALDTSKTQHPVPLGETLPVQEKATEAENVEQAEEEGQLIGPPSLIPILERLKNIKVLNGDGEEIEYTLRPISKRPPLILPQTEYEVDTPLDEVANVNMSSINPSPLPLVDRTNPLNLAPDVEDTKEQPVFGHEGGKNESSHYLDELHGDEECVPTTTRLSQEDLSEWKRHITQEPNVEEQNADGQHPALETQEDMNTPLQYAHLGPTSEVLDTKKRVESFTQFPKFTAIEWQGSEEVISRTHEWSKTLSDAEPNSRVSSIRSHDAKDETSLWAGFEGTHPTKGSAERLEEHDVAASPPQRYVLSRSSALKVNKRRSRPDSGIESQTAIQPTPVKSSRVSKRNASLPVLNTGSTLLDTAVTRKEQKKKQRSLSSNFLMEESQGTVARRNFGSHGKIEEPSLCDVESTDLDDITLSQVRRTIHTRGASNSQVSSISSRGHRTSSSVGCQSPGVTTARTTPTVSSPVITTTNSASNFPHFVQAAPPLRTPYPMPPYEGFQPSPAPHPAPPYWYSKTGAFTPGHPYANDAMLPTTFQCDNPPIAQRMSAPVVPSLMDRVTFDEELKQKRTNEQLEAQRRGVADEAAKRARRERARRRQTLEITERMGKGELEKVHQEHLRKMQREATKNLERQNNQHY